MEDVDKKLLKSILADPRRCENCSHFHGRARNIGRCDIDGELVNALSLCEENFKRKKSRKIRYEG